MRAAWTAWWWVAVAAPLLSQPLTAPFADSVGLPAPRVALVEDGLRTGGPFALYFTGDGGPDQIRQDLTLAEWLAEPDAPPLIIAEDDTERGDAAFDAFRVTRIPSLVFIDAAGVITAAFAGAADIGALQQAITTGGIGPVRQSVASAGLRLLFFHAEWGRFSVQQRDILLGLQEGDITVTTLDMDNAADAERFVEYGVTAVPTLIAIDAQGAPLARVERVLTLNEILGQLLLLK